MNTNEIVVDVKDFSFSYDSSDGETQQRAIENINFQVCKGEFFCIIGPNEAGKSTLCNALVGLIPHFFHGNMEGDIIILGENTQATNVADLSFKIGLVFQDPFNQLTYTTTSVAEELAYGLGNIGVPREEMRKRVKEVAKIMHIDHLLQKNPLELSGGQVQRVALGSVFVMNPEIIVLDECTAQLDPLGSKEIFDVVKDLNSRGITVIMADNDMERVAEYSDHVLILHQNKMVKWGETKEVFSSINFASLDLRPPAYVSITEEYIKRGLWKKEIALKEKEVINISREIINR
ncbi:MAG: ABC transporter ATP-binding protein [Anaerolineaceae bacterium]|jgi:energy-coupling factor transport system ATP-binding protein|nr:MAG: ABC transporter ATP-binding protein [Anaerolineaceae bacterium]